MVPGGAQVTTDKFQFSYILDFPGSGLSGDVSTGHPCSYGPMGLAALALSPG